MSINRECTKYLALKQNVHKEDNLSKGDFNEVIVFIDASNLISWLWYYNHH